MCATFRSRRPACPAATLCFFPRRRPGGAGAFWPPRPPASPRRPGPERVGGAARAVLRLAASRTLRPTAPASTRCSATQGTAPPSPRGAPRVYRAGAPAAMSARHPAGAICSSGRPAATRRAASRSHRPGPWTPRTCAPRPACRATSMSRRWTRVRPRAWCSGNRSAARSARSAPRRPSMPTSASSALRRSRGRASRALLSPSSATRARPPTRGATPTRATSAAGRGSAAQTDPSRRLTCRARRAETRL